MITPESAVLTTFSPLLQVDIYLPPGYPSRPPVAYVRLGAPNLYLKEHHAHVGSDGHVYLPYLHEWSPRTHNLVELVVAMSSVFSADPPVFTRTTPKPPSVTTLDRDTQQQLEAAMIREAEEESRKAEEARLEAIRQQEAAQREAEEMRAAQLAFEERKRLQVKEALTKKLRSHLVDLSHQTKLRIQSDRQDQKQLNRHELAKQIDFLEKLKASLEQNHETIDSKTAEIQAWLAQQHSTTFQKQETSVDDLVVVSNKQLLDLSAENAALTDALYFLDRALQKGTLPLHDHLKHVRQLAKRQFLVRALLHKISQTNIRTKLSV